MADSVSSVYLCVCLPGHLICVCFPGQPNSSLEFGQLCKQQRILSQWRHLTITDMSAYTDKCLGHCIVTTTFSYVRSVVVFIYFISFINYVRLKQILTTLPLYKGLYFNYVITNPGGRGYPKIVTIDDIIFYWIVLAELTSLTCFYFRLQYNI